jgi:hypothetical protein
MAIGVYHIGYAPDWRLYKIVDIEDSELTVVQSWGAGATEFVWNTYQESLDL